MRQGLLLGGLAMAAGVALAGEDPFAFMPDGGRGLFPRVFQGAEAQREALASDRDAEAWQAEFAAVGLGEREAATLAGYLALVAPIAPPDGEDPATALPPDGRDLALAQCQSCHSLFAGYLMQRRDRAGWLAIFASPFHKDIPMSEAERAIFADFSSINMPMRVEEVPPELRF